MCSLLWTPTYINFLSGIGAKLGDRLIPPIDIATNRINLAIDQIGQQTPMNPRLFDFLQSQKPGRFGTLLMDFPDNALISTIISLNEDIRSIGK